VPEDHEASATAKVSNRPLALHTVFCRRYGLGRRSKRFRRRDPTALQNSSCRECVLAVGPLVIEPRGFFCLGSRLPACKNDFGREERTPLTCGGVMVLRAADELVAAIEVADEAGGAKPRNECLPHGPKIEVNCPRPD